MAEQYKVLGAMIALREFTVEELAKRTNVKNSTINTVLYRKRPQLEEIGYEETGRRGGQPKKYRIKPDQFYALQAELENLYLDLPAPVPPKHELQTVPEMPLGILAAEDTLLRRYSKATNLKEKQKLLKLATLDYQKGRLASDRILENNTDVEIRQSVESSLERLEALKGIYEVDLAVNSLVAEQENAEAAQPAELLSRFEELGRQISGAVSKLRAVWKPTTYRLAGGVQSPQTPRPEYWAYLEAKSVLDRVATNNYSDETERAEYLARADTALESVQRDAEEQEVSETTAAFIQYEQGRLNFLTQNYEAARGLFEEAKKAFASLKEYADEVAKIDQHLTCIDVQRQLSSWTATTAKLEVSLTLSTLERVKLTSGDQPLVGMLKSMLSKLSDESSERERELKGEVARLREALDKSKSTTTNPFVQPYMQPHFTQGYIGGGVPNLFGVAEFHNNALEQVGILNREYGQSPEDLELKVAVALGSETPLPCSVSDLSGRGYSKREGGSALSALRAEGYVMNMLK